MKKVWFSTSGIYLPLCKSCMIKFIDILPDQDSCDHKGLADLVDKYRPTQKYASAKAKLTKPQLQAELDYQILRNEQLEKATGAIIAGLFRQQLKMMVKNARDTIREEEKAEVEKKEEATVAAPRASTKDMQLNDAGNTNEEKINAGNSDGDI